MKGTDCIGSCKSNNHTITTTTAPHLNLEAVQSHKISKNNLKTSIIIHNMCYTFVLGPFPLKVGPFALIIIYIIYMKVIENKWSINDICRLPENRRSICPDQQKCSRTDDFKIYIKPNVRENCLNPRKQKFVFLRHVCLLYLYYLTCGELVFWCSLIKNRNRFREHVSIHGSQKKILWWYMYHASVLIWPTAG